MEQLHRVMDGFDRFLTFCEYSSKTPTIGQMVVEGFKNWKKVDQVASQLIVASKEPVVDIAYETCISLAVVAGTFTGMALSLWALQECWKRGAVGKVFSAGPFAMGTTFCLVMQQEVLKIAINRG